ncbi:MAG: cation:proton antiporter [Candidatus Limnocylindrales bacterium]|jgi:Kef-type K+ transport system membrane component KefB
MFDSLLVIIVAGLVGPVLAAGRRPLIPSVIGELIAGIAIGRSGLGLIDPTTPANALLYGLGFAMLMLVAGSHVDLQAPGLRSSARIGAIAAALVALLSLPVGLGIGLSLAPAAPSLLFPVLLAGSSAAVAFPILEERDLIGPGVGLLLVWIPLADVLTVLLMPLTLIGAERIPSALGGDALIVACTVTALSLGERVARSPGAMTLRDRSQTRGWALQLRVTLLILVVLSLIAARTGGSTLLAGFGAGLVLARLREPTRLEVQLSGIAEGFFVPAFFVLLGSELDLRALAGEPSAIALAVAMAAGGLAIHLIAGRAVAPSPWSGFGLAAAAQLGLPAAAASLGLSTGSLSPAVAAAIVLGACLTVLPAALGTRRLADALASPPSSASDAASTARTVPHQTDVHGS